MRARRVGLVLAVLGGALVVGFGVALFVPPSPSVDEVPAGFVERRFDTGEVTLRYVEGPARGAPLVLIPGQMEGWQGYRLVMEQLSQTHHVFVVELRGHGGSSRTPGRYSYVACGEDVRRFLVGVVREPAFVSGLSSGGVIAAWVAAHAPEQVRGVVLEDPPIFSSLWPRIRDERYMSRLFQVAVEKLGAPGGPDLEGWLSEQGAPKLGSDELQKIPPGFARLVGRLFAFAKWLRPEHPWDAPF
ncbi:MAG: alpha/beta fold hydrolase [Myxococcota bacterium]